MTMSGGEAEDVGVVGVGGVVGVTAASSTGIVASGAPLLRRSVRNFRMAREGERLRSVGEGENLLTSMEGDMRHHQGEVGLLLRPRPPALGGGEGARPRYK